MRAKPFEDNMLYIVDGELLNHMLKICKSFGRHVPEHQEVLNYMIQSIIQCTNYPTGEVNDQLDEIDFEHMLWKFGIKLLNPNNPCSKGGMSNEN